MNITGNLRVENLAQIPQEVIELDQAFFPQPWNLSQWQGLNLTQNLLLALSENNQLIGTALLGALEGDDTAHLFKLLIHPKYRRNGMALRFWPAIVEILNSKGFKKVYLEVESSNGPAIRFYKKVGFKLLRISPAYYSNGSDGLMMELTLQVGTV